MEQVHFRSGYKYILEKPHAHELMFLRDLPDTEGRYATIRKGILYINAGYAWDGCSGPTFDTQTNHRAGLVHDALYQLIRLGGISAYRKEDCDKEFREICKQDGMNWARRMLYFQGVHNFGGASIEPGAERPVEIWPTNAKWVKL